MGRVGRRAVTSICGASMSAIAASRLRRGSVGAEKPDGRSESVNGAMGACNAASVGGGAFAGRSRSRGAASARRRASGLIRFRQSALARLSTAKRFVSATTKRCESRAGSAARTVTRGASFEAVSWNDKAASSLSHKNISSTRTSAASPRPSAASSAARPPRAQLVPKAFARPPPPGASSASYVSLTDRPAPSPRAWSSVSSCVTTSSSIKAPKSAPSSSFFGAGVASLDLFATTSTSSTAARSANRAYAGSGAHLSERPAAHGVPSKRLAADRRLSMPAASSLGASKPLSHASAAGACASQAAHRSSFAARFATSSSMVFKRASDVAVFFDSSDAASFISASPFPAASSSAADRPA
mmetsp:Transcript_32754/g.110327  ORF Transcript_32754/g.110327 Transcript_32754/m.110327 type:complete len:357 (-) Transcript_32754:624-1694(-)